MNEIRCPYGGKKGNHKYTCAYKTIEVQVENEFQSTKQVTAEPVAFCESCGFPLLRKNILLTGEIKK